MSPHPDAHKPLTWRQLRLLDFMRNPQHPDLPPELINTNTMFWSVRQLTRMSNVCDGYTVAMCTRDLRALDAHRKIGLIIEKPMRLWKLGALP